MQIIDPKLTPAEAAASAGVSFGSMICMTISSRRVKVSRAILVVVHSAGPFEITGGLAISSVSNPVRMDPHNNLLNLHI